MFDERGAPLVCSRASAKQVDQFASGFCHVFALALHRRYGWRLRALGDPADEYSLHPWNGISSLPDHVYCLRDDGSPVDIHGLWADEVAIRRFFAREECPDEVKVSVGISEEQLLHELPAIGYPRILDKDMQDAIQVVEGLALPGVSPSSSDYDVEM